MANIPVFMSPSSQLGRWCSVEIRAHQKSIEVSPTTDFLLLGVALNLIDLEPETVSLDATTAALHTSVKDWPLAPGPIDNHSKVIICTLYAGKKDHAVVQLSLTAGAVYSISKSGPHAIILYGCSISMGMPRSISTPAATIDCRCGVNVNNIQVYGDLIQCSSCKMLSHVACQRFGRASHHLSNTVFDCDKCNLNHFFGQRSQEERRFHVMASRAAHVEPQSSRLLPGYGALAKWGEFFYPVRLIRKFDNTWIASWWRGNQYTACGVAPANISSVHQTDLVDCLWQDQSGRRKTRLGRWLHACDAETVEDILADPTKIPYTDEVAKVLSPHKAVFAQLASFDFKGLEGFKIPAKDWLEGMVLPHRTIIPHVGPLSVTSRAQLANWFDVHVTERDLKRRSEWLGRLPIAHAHTVFIADLLSKNRDLSELNEDQLLEKAWNVQVSGPSSGYSVEVDVDKECLYRLEEDMFEVSNEAGTSGYYQWGLDAGSHQDGWYPYAGLPEAWQGEYYPSDPEDLLKEGPAFLECKTSTTPISQVESTPRPKPKPIFNRPKPKPIFKGSRLLNAPSV